jgi:hypothetical protein
MRQRPRVFDLLALALLLVAFSLPVQVMLMFGHTPGEFTAIFNQLAPMNWVVAMLAVACAVAHWRASPTLWILSPLFILAVGWNNYLVAQAGLNFSWATTLLATGATLALHGLLLTPTARKVLLNPKMRWWLTAPRKRVQLRATIWPVLGGELLTSTYDVSEGGAFFSLEEASWTSRRTLSIKNLSVGTVCTLKMKLDSGRAIQCDAEVVRQAEPRGQYPGGFAVRFKSLSREDQKALAQLLRQAPATGSSGGSVASAA